MLKLKNVLVLLHIDKFFLIHFLIVYRYDNFCSINTRSLENKFLNQYYNLQTHIE